MNFIQRLEKVEQFLTTVNDDIKEAYKSTDIKLEPSKSLKETLESYTQEGRLLRIGIVGRVKAGKSSLLNALLFDGDDILPKAATPMTAALTIMEYSDKIRAEVDFFTADDCAEIQKNARQYSEELSKKRQEKFQALADNTRLNDAQKRERADKQAEREMKDSDLFASFDQQQRMAESGVSLSSLQKLGTLNADTLSDLMNQLKAYVGADGKYMPFTKAVKIYMPLESLKGLEIIDTPGLNDPITSRGKRTEDMLATCDVVLLVSPAGQMLNSADMELLGSVTESKGISEAYVVASQVDNQLPSQAAQLQSDNLPEVLSAVAQELTQHARQVFTQQVHQNPDMQGVLERFAKNDVVTTSGLAFSLYRRFDKQNEWDEGMQHTFDYLKRVFPKHFVQEDTSRATLEKLANIGKVESIIVDTSSRKESIQQKKKDDLLAAQQQLFEDLKPKWLKAVDSLITELKQSSAEEIKAQQTALNKEKDSIRKNVDNTYQQQIVDVKADLSRDLKNQLSKEMRKFMPDNARDTKIEQEAYTHSYDVKVRDRSFTNRISFGLFGDDEKWVTRTETRYRDKEVQVVYAAQIRQQIKNILDDLEDQLDGYAQKHIREWRKKLQPTITRAFREKAETVELDKLLNTLDNSIKVVIRQIPEADFRIDKSLPSTLTSGATLKGSEGDRFIEQAGNYMQNLQGNIRDQIQGYIDTFSRRLQHLDVSQEVLKAIDKNLSDLAEKLKNAEANLRRLEQNRREIEAL